MKKRILSIILAFVMVLSLAPMSAFADESTNVYAVLKSDGLLYATNSDNTSPTDTRIDYKNTITHLFVADDVTTIDVNAFSACVNLVFVDMPEVTSIGINAFNNCYSLSTVNMPKVGTISRYAFTNSSLITVEMPEVISVDEFAFHGCVHLTTVDMPKVTTIAEQAFQGCSALSDVKMPKASYVGTSAFGGCAVTTVKMPEVTTVDAWAFSYCLNLTTVELPKVTSIGSSAFQGCTALANLTVGAIPPTVSGGSTDTFNCSQTAATTTLTIDGGNTSEAIAGYKAVNDGNNSDNYWYIWPLPSASTYTVTYNGNGSTGGSVPTDSNSPYASGVSVTVLDNTGSLVKENHTFDGWSYNSTTYQKDDTFPMPSANVTLTAVWTATGNWSDGITSVTTTWDNGGTITTAAQLAQLAYNVNNGKDYTGKTITLGNDISLSGHAWTPIGLDFFHSFKGSFNGNDKKITGITIGSSSEPESTLTRGGLFGNVVGGTIKNLGVEATIYSNKSSAYVGALVGYSVATIINCYATGSVVGGASAYVGGLVGFNMNSGGKISNSYATGNVTGGDSARVGGLVGLNDGSIMIGYATGNVTGGDSARVGGLIGSGGATFGYWNSDAAQTVNGSAQDPKKGFGYIGSFDDSTGMTSDDMKAASFVRKLNSNQDVYPDQTLYKWRVKADDYPAFSDVLWPNTTVPSNWADGISATTAAWDNGGTITTAAELAQFAYNVNKGKNYIGQTITLGNDISLSGHAWTPIGLDAAHTFRGTFDGNANKITGLTIGLPGDPEGTLVHVGLFGCVINGAIKNLGVEAAIYSKKDTASIGGLVGTNQGTITRSYAAGTLYSANTSTNETNVGGLVGKNVQDGGTIANCYATDNIMADGYYIWAGGLVGFNYGTIKNSYATGNITGIPVGAGGLIGADPGTTANSYATGNTASGSEYRAGGLMGSKSNPNTTASYWNSDATQMNSQGSQTPRGVGSGNQSNVIGMTSDEMKAAPFVATLNSNLDVLADATLYKWQVKADDYPTFSDTLWSATTTTIGKTITIGTTAPVRDAAITNGTSTAPAGATGPVIAWSADNGTSWTASGSFAANTVYKTKYVYAANAGYQFDSTIAATDISVTNLGSGTKNVALTDSNKTLTITVTWPTTAAPAPPSNWADGITSVTNTWDNGGTITTAAQLAQFAYNVNNGKNYIGKTITLGNDISLSGHAWTPIGVDDAHAFRGTFDGNDKKITGLTIGTSSAPESTLTSVGLFGNVVDGTIKNLGVDAAIYSNKRSAWIGGLVGHNSDTIINSYATGSVAGGEFANVGGLTGRNNKIITNSYATGDVTGGEQAKIGGLTGFNFKTIRNSHATGNVSAGGSTLTQIGGLAGFNEGTIINSYATGNVTGGSYATGGGLVGYNLKTITNSYAAGNVTGGASAFVGGAVGDNSGSNSEAYNLYWNSDATQMVNGSAQDPKKGVKNGTSDGVTSMTSDEMKAASFVTTLNANLDTLVDATLYKWQVKAGDYPTFSATLWSGAPTEKVTISGTVRDKGGNPVAGATVALTPAAGTPNSAITDTDGKYTINDVPAGSYTVTVTLPNNGGSFTKDITVPGGSMDIQQPTVPTYTVGGSIRDTADSSPVSGATVTLTNTADSTKTYTGTTDINGSYTITGVPDGSYTVDITKGSEVYGGTVITVNGSNVSGGSANISVIPTYSVTYHGNGSPDAVPIDSAHYKKETNARVMGKGSLAINGYNFTGWNTAADGSGTSYKVNDTFVIKGNVTLYAQWKAIDSAQIPVFTGSNVRGMEAVTQGAVTTTLSVTVLPVTDGGAITYQWYQSATNSIAGGIPIPGETGSSCTPPSSTAGTTYYYVVVTNTAPGVPAASNTSSMREVVVLENPAAAYNVSTSSTSLTNITLSNANATQYQNYTTTISAVSGYTLPNSIAVTMGGITLIPGVDYVYSRTSSTTGTVTVYNVTGEISVTAAGTPIPAQTYTISFNSNGADTVTAAINAACGAAIVLPTPAKTGYTFGGWYRDSSFATSYHSATMGKEDITLYAKWEQMTYVITGNVKDEDNANVSASTVTLMAGSRQIAQATTDASGNFTISGVPKGTYNLVISNGTDKTITLTVTVSDSNIATGSVTLPKGNKNSVVEVKQDTPDIVVDKLNDFFNSDKFTQDDSNVVDAGGTVEIKLFVEKKDESGDNAAANADNIKTSAGGSGKTVGIFLNLTISKIITPAGGAAEQPILIDQLSDLLIIDIPLPVELQGKSGYVIYRYHGSVVQTITGAVNADGEYIEVNANGNSIKLHTKKFSTYAVGYTTPSTPPIDTTPSTPANKADGAVPSAITTEPSEGGKIDIGTDNMTSTIIPDDGYAIADVIVDGKSMGATEKYTFTDSNAHKISAVFVKENALPYYNQGGAKVYIGFSAITGKLCKYIAPPGVTVEFTENQKYFTDNTIAQTKPSIDFVTEREIFLGTGQNIFSPNEVMTRAMFVTVIGRLYEHSFGSVSGTSTFLDVDANAYYAKYVAWAKANGIINGVGGNKFAPLANATREQMAVIMFNFANLLKKTTGADVSLTYPDRASISSWAINAVKYFHETNIIEARTDGSFAPQESATRAEVSAILQRFIVNMLK